MEVDRELSETDCWPLNTERCLGNIDGLRERSVVSGQRSGMTLLVLLFASQVGAADKPDFAREVQPILSENCYACHGPDAKARKADLRLDTREGALRKKDPVIVPGKSADSELIKRIVSADENEAMPPPHINKMISAKQLATLKAWIDTGAAWGTHWAFVPPKRGEGFQSIDSYIRARLEKEGLKPSPEAGQETLLRRVTLDLTGLPPTAAERGAFLTDDSPEAYSKIVDRLLKSPRFGERMVWEWLEAARYADSNGYQGDGERTMYPWRDWAVRAFNSNMPYDRFTVEQIAGDLLPNATPGQKLATGFLRNHPINGEGGRIAEENRVDYGMDMAETVATVWLGLTFNCCRCHDHKFDPIAQKEYYGLFAFFNQTPVNGGGGDPFTKPTIDWPTPEQTAALAKATEAATKLATAVTEAEAKLEKPKDPPKDIADALKVIPANRTKAQIDALEKKFGVDKPYAANLAELGKAVEACESIRRSIPRVMVMEDMPKPRDSFIYEKGLYNKPGAKVGPLVPAVLPPLKADKPDRLALANWLVSKEHPLTARVAVNRLWQQFFGIGLVKTSNDFGVQGERPSHPELLDWLAVDFVESGWDTKRFVKAIVLSATYRQSSKATKELRERDPENRLLARAPRYRLPSWMIRDQALAASGLLVDKSGGPPVKPYQPGGVWEEATFGGKRYEADTGEGLYRRSIYTFWRRIVGPTMFFDVSPRLVCSVKSSRTNTPLHALLTLNDTTFVEAGRALAQSVLSKEKATDAERIAMAFRAILTRAPKPVEATILGESLGRLRGQYKRDPQAAKDLLAIGASKPDAKLDAGELAAWAALCNLLFNTDEALSKE